MLLGIHSTQDIIMEKVEEFYLILLTEFDALDFYDLVLILFQAYVDDAASRIEKAYYCLGEVKFDGLVFERPPVILELLIGRFAELAKNTRRFMLKDQSATDQFFVFALSVLGIFFYPI